MSTDSQKALKRRTHFDELEALLEERNLEVSKDAEESAERPSFFYELEALLEEKNFEHQKSSLDGIEEPAPSVAKKPTCHSEQDCNRTEDTYWLLHSFQRGPS